MKQMHDPTHVNTLILGGGFSGVGVAIALMNRGLHDFLVLEKASQLGGTWRENTYPGCACDVPSHLYSYSFAPNAEWKRTFAEQPEIQAYLLDVAERFGVMPHVRLGAEATRAAWDDSAQRWRVETPKGVFVARFVVGSQGPLHEPRIPDLPGLDGFKGKIFHSAQWDHDHPLEGERVAVVGTGSSAIQFVPRIQPQVAALHVFQRTPGWVLPKPDHEVGAVEAAAYRHVPGFLRGVRRAIYAGTEVLQMAQRRPERMRRLQRLAEWQLRRQVKDAELRAALTPDWTLGCKRMLLSNTYYPALQAPNAELVPQGVREIGPDHIVAQDGTVRGVDTIIFGTGFRVTDASLPSRIFADGRSLADAWEGSPEAHLGMTVHGFPNMFMVLGPNTGNGHGSAFTIIEAQAEYIAEALQRARDQGWARLEVREQVQRRFVQEVDTALRDTVWNAGGCNSWYLDGTGRNSTIYPWSTVDLRRRMRRLRAGDFHIRSEPSRARAASRGVVAITGAAQGIGRATAEQFVAAGWTVLLGDVDHAGVERVAASLGRAAHALHLDVSLPESWEGFAAEGRALGGIDVLVNNAGIMPSGGFLDEPLDSAEKSMAVNYLGLVYGMRAVLPEMRDRGAGHVINVASLAGKFAVPGLATYAASKHAAVGLTAAVRQEMAGTGVHLTTIMPTAVDTGLTQGIPLGRLAVQQPDDVARAILKAYQTKAPEVTVPEWAKPAVPAYGLIPRRALPLLARALNSTRLMRADVRERRDAYEARSRAQVGRRAPGEGARASIA